MLLELAAGLPVEKTSWETYFFAAALIQTTRCDCTRRQFGCIAVSPNRRIVACGYNAPPSGEESAVERCGYRKEGCCKDPAAPQNQGYDTCNALHAEANCLGELGTQNPYEYVDLYVAGRDGMTGELVKSSRPCIYCSRIIKNYNVRHIYSLNSDATWEILTKGDLVTLA